MVFNFKKLWVRSHKVGLVLSGGGLRGIGHLGAIKALEEHGYKPSIISGCSMGAIIGAFYAAGYSVDAMLRIIEENNLFPTTSFRLRTSGFVDNRFVSQLIQKHIPQNTFESLNVPLYVSVTNFVSGKTEYLSSGTLDDALLASSSIPLIFPSVKRDRSVYYDGGILDNLPVTPLLGECKVLIGVHVNAPDQILPEKLTPAKILDRITHLAIGRSVAQNAQKCDLFFEPPEMLRFGIFGKKDLRAIYEYVYTYVSQRIDNG